MRLWGSNFCPHDFVLLMLGSVSFPFHYILRHPMLPDVQKMYPIVGNVTAQSPARSFLAASRYAATAAILPARQRREDQHFWCGVARRRSIL